MTAERKIYVDLDDVLSQTGQTFLDVLEEDFGRRVEFESIVDFDLGHSFEMDAEELERFMHHAHAPEILARMVPIPGAVEVLAAWRAAGYRVEVVTGRPPSAFRASREWLERHRFPHDALRFVDKYGRGGVDPETGVEATPIADLARDGYCLAIEDAAHVGRYLAGELGIPVILLERPWNRGESLGVVNGTRMVRCRDWTEIGERFPVV
jgi:uncharacterized HAD superfamily protein